MPLKLRLFAATVASLFLYGCEIWTFTPKLVMEIDGHQDVAHCAQCALEAAHRLQRPLWRPAKALCQDQIESNEICEPLVQKPIRTRT